MFLNLQFQADKGPMTEAEMRGLIERADSLKMQWARECLAVLKITVHTGLRLGHAFVYSFRRQLHDAAILLSVVFFAGMLTLQYERSWTAAERLYLSDYLKRMVRGKTSATASACCRGGWNVGEVHLLDGGITAIHVHHGRPRYAVCRTAQENRE